MDSPQTPPAARSFGCARLGRAAAGRPAACRGPYAQNLRFVAGGIGLDESEQMKALANEFSLTVVVAATTGAYLADTQVSIHDAEGQSVLGQRPPGPPRPYLLVELAAGRYDVEAVHNGIRQQRRILVGNNSRGSRRVRL